MGADDRTESLRTPCDFGKGEYVFYDCQLDGWSFVNNPSIDWYEMHIFCSDCRHLFKDYSPSQFSRSGEKTRWRIQIPERDKVPEH